MQVKEEASKAKEGKREAEGDVLLLTERVRVLELNLAAAKESYAEVKTLAMDYAAAKGITKEEGKKAKQELKKEKICSHALGTNVDRLKKIL